MKSDISLGLKKRMLQCYMWPVLLYSSKSWSVSKAAFTLSAENGRETIGIEWSFTLHRSSAEISLFGSSPGGKSWPTARVNSLQGMPFNQNDQLFSTITVLLAVTALLAKKKRKRNYTARRVWVSALLKERQSKGAWGSIIPDLQPGIERSRGTFSNYFRMNERCFESLLAKVAPFITKQDTRFRKAIGPEQRLAATLRFLATGCSYTELYYNFRISASLLCQIVPETCEAIYQVLQQEHMSTPCTAKEWQDISAQLFNRWQFPNGIGALDGKHIAMVKPWHASSYYHNYKGTESLVLLAMCDAEYRFTYVSVGANGRVSDGGVFGTSSLADALEAGTLGIPPAAQLPASEKVLPYVIVADEAFPLKPYLMRPYPRRALDHSKKVFNYRLSRMRRLIENSFGIMTSTWRVLNHKMALQPENVTKVTLAACVLHNFLINEKQIAADVNEVLQGNNVRGNEGLGQLHAIAGRSPEDARKIRDEYCNYMNNEGAVPWQDQMV